MDCKWPDPRQQKCEKKMLSHQDLQIQGANNNIEVGVGKVTGNSAARNLGHSFLRPLVSKKKGEGGGTVVHHVVFLLPGFSRCLCSSLAPFRLPRNTSSHTLDT